MSLLIRLGQFVEEMRQSWCFDERTRFDVANLKAEVAELKQEVVDLELRLLDYIDLQDRKNR